MRTALGSEFLGPTQTLLAQLGPENVWQTTGQLGLSSLVIPAGEPAQRLLLEGGALSILELSQAYSAFNNQGVLLGYTQGGSSASGAPAPLEAISVLRVVDRNGRIWAEVPPPQARPLVSPQLAYLIIHALSDESARWPGFGHPSPLEIRPARRSENRIHPRSPTSLDDRIYARPAGRCAPGSRDRRCIRGIGAAEDGRRIVACAHQIWRQRQCFSQLGDPARPELHRCM